MKQLGYYKCRHCATWAVTAGDGGPYVRCQGCGGAKKFEYFVPADDDEQYRRMFHLAKELGVLHLPLNNKHWAHVRGMAS